MDIGISEHMTLVAAFFVGLFGGVHCVGMCGGIVTAVSFSLTPQARPTKQQLPFLLAYNLGRILSYSLAGALLGGIGWLAAEWSQIHTLQRILQAIAAFFMIALGLYLAGWWRGITHIEQLGSHVWRRIEPLSKGLLPVKKPQQALFLGAIWGWLPCGLVYSVLIWAIAVADAVQGALLLLAFGLGTLPNLLAMGLLAAKLSAFTRKPLVKALAGLLVISFGVISLFQVSRAWLA